MIDVDTVIYAERTHLKLDPVLRLAVPLLPSLYIEQSWPGAHCICGERGKVFLVDSVQKRNDVEHPGSCSSSTQRACLGMREVDYMMPKFEETSTYTVFYMLVTRYHVMPR